MRSVGLTSEFAFVVRVSFESRPRLILICKIDLYGRGFFATITQAVATADRFRLINHTAGKLF